MACVKPSRMHFLAQVAHTSSLPEALGPHLYLCLTTVSCLTSGLVLMVEMSELSKPEEDLQDSGEAQGPVEVPLLEAEMGESTFHLASNPPASSSAPVEALPQEILNEMMANLMKFLLLSYRAKELTSQAEMLKVFRGNQEYFPMVFRQTLQ